MPYDLLVVLTVILGVAFLITLVLFIIAEKRKSNFRKKFFYNVEQLADSAMKLRRDSDDVFTIVESSLAGGLDDEAKDKWDFYGKNFLDFISTEDRSRILTVLERVIKMPGVSVEVQYRFNAPDGKIWLLSKIAAEQNGSIYCFSQNVTKLKKVEETLRVSEEKFKLAMSHMTEIFFDYDHETKVIKVSDNEKVRRYFPKTQFTAEELFAFDFIVKEDLPLVKEAFNSIVCGESYAGCLVRIKGSDSIHYYKVAITNIFDTLSLPVSAIGTALDVTAEKENALKAEKEKAHRESLMKQSLAAYIMDVSKRQVVAAYVDGQSVETVDEGADYLLREIENIIHEDDREKMDEWLSGVLSDRKKVKNTFISSCDYRRLVDGEYRWCNCSVSIYEEEGDDFALICVRDINARKLEEQALQYRADRDPLTGIFNRSSITNYATEKIDKAPSGKNSAIFCLDIDDFKSINDRNGHAEGDRILKEAANLFAASCKLYGEAGRIGGDEFLCVISDFGTKKTATDIAESIIKKARGIKAADGRPLRLSIGIAFAPDDATESEKLYHLADEALYEAKARGKERVVVYGDMASN